MMHTTGISYEGDVLDLAMAQKIVVRSGAWFRYGDVHLGQGREKARNYLLDNPQIVEELKEKVMAAGITGNKLGVAAASEDGDSSATE
jgi:recombination protein RecA